MKTYKDIIKSKETYQKNLLESSYLEKFKALIRLQEKAKFFSKIKYKFSEPFKFSKLIDILNDLKINKIINDYVLGGASALLYYSTPHLTEDIDIFISIENQGLLFNLTDVRAFLKKKYHAKEEEECILINGNPIRFLIPDDKLSKEAFDNADIITVENKKFKIFKLEYLTAIMLFIFKPKYRERLRIVKEENKYDAVFLNELLNKYNLENKWKSIIVDKKY